MIEKEMVKEPVPISSGPTVNPRLSFQLHTHPLLGERKTEAEMERDRETKMIRKKRAEGERKGKERKEEDFPGGPTSKIPELPLQEA